MLLCSAFADIEWWMAMRGKMWFRALIPISNWCTIMNFIRFRYRKRQCQDICICFDDKRTVHLERFINNACYFTRTKMRLPRTIPEYFTYVFYLIRIEPYIGKATLVQTQKWEEEKNNIFPWWARRISTAQYSVSQVRFLIVRCCGTQIDVLRLNRL